MKKTGMHVAAAAKADYPRIHILRMQSYLQSYGNRISEGVNSRYTGQKTADSINQLIAIIGNPRDLGQDQKKIRAMTGILGRDGKNRSRNPFSSA